MQVLNPNAAGIDVGDTMHAVAVPPGRCTEPVRKFGAFTCDLQAIAAWLQECGIDTVAMESTGVYWKPLYALLIMHGFEVLLVNAKQTANVSGKKTDMSDAAWIQQLHSCGLLTTSFLPDDLTESLRTVTRQRRALMQDGSRCVQRIQKNLELMNIKTHTVISDIMGKSGKGIIEAIIAGERDPVNFLPLVDPRIRADKDTIVKSLTGNWRQECLFLVKQNYGQYQQLQQHVKDCEIEIECFLQQMGAINNGGFIEEEAPRPGGSEAACGQAGMTKKASDEKKKQKQKNKNSPSYDVRKYLEKIHGVDVMEIFGISEISALEILSETGTDLSRWGNEMKFVSWLNLCPNNKITGGKLVSSKLMKKTPNAACQGFRAAANSLKFSDNWLGDYFRRMRAKGGQKYAIVATARKLAIIYYKMVRYKKSFMPVDIEQYREEQRQAKIEYLEKKLIELKKQAA